jgi:phage-related protein
VATLGKAVLVVEGDWSGLQKEAEQQTKGPLASTFGAGFGKLAAVAGGALAAGAIVGGLKDSVEAASDLGEAVNVTGLVFGDAAAGMDDFFAASATNLGMAESTARQAAGNVGSLLGNLGFGAEEAAGATEQLLGRAADLGSAFNAEPAEVVGALGAALRGETEPARRFGIMLDKAAIKAKAVEMGLADSTGAVDKNAEAQAAMALIMEQSSKVQGDFLNTSDGMANSQRQLAAMWTDMQATLGQALLPALTSVMGAFKEMMPTLQPVIAALGQVLGKALAALVPALMQVVEALVPFVSQLVDVLAPILPSIADLLAQLLVAILPLLPPFMELAEALLPALVEILVTVMPLVTLLANLLSVVLAVAADVLVGAIHVLMGVFRTLVGVIKGIPNAASSMVEWFRQLPGKLVGFVTSLPEKLKNIGRSMLLQLKAGAVGAFDAVRNWFSDLPSKILRAVGNLARVLWNAGLDILEGLLGGIKEGFEKVKDFVGGIGGAIASLKGPKQYDLALLRPAGNWIMAGLGRGLAEGFGPVAAQVAAMGPQLSTAFAGEITSGVPLGGGAPVDARVIVQGSVIGLEELDHYVDQRDRKLAQALGARR